MYLRKVKKKKLCMRLYKFWVSEIEMHETLEVGEKKRERKESSGYKK